MPHQYLWAVGNAWKPLVQEQRLGHRYRWLHSNLFVDLQPDQPPEFMAELPEMVLPYLRLSSYCRHIPRPYTVLVELAEQPLKTPVLLLEQAAIAPSPAFDNTSPRLLPTLAQQWPQASPLTQLNWLWQLASLWEPLQSERVVSTLFVPDLIRLDGTTIRLLELQGDGQNAPSSITALATPWLPLAEQANPAIAPYLQSLVEKLNPEEYRSAEQVLVSLERQLQHWGIEQHHAYDVAVATATDQGPTRKRNEDACFPPSGSATTYRAESRRAGAPAPAPAPALPAVPFVIVCDGIGGHAGGDVASKLAIQRIQQYVTPLLQAQDPAQVPDATLIRQTLREAICAANDDIAQRNDQEQRKAQGRMGTTVVAALVVAESLYIAHLGDSRAYRITPHSCHQITVDDDVASREVRLGYSLYRESLTHPGSGALVQALGMTSSKQLYPTVQRLVLDEDCLIVLCSDGLSDHDLIENTWAQRLRPMLQGHQSVAEGAQDLIQLANTCNGHDNVTVGLLKIQVRPPTSVPPKTVATVFSAPAMADIPITDFPVEYGPGNRGLADYEPTDYGPGDRGPAAYGPTDYGPEDRGPGDRGPAAYGPEDRGPGDQRPGDQRPGAPQAVSHGPGITARITATPVKTLQPSPSTTEVAQPLGPVGRGQPAAQSPRSNGKPWGALMLSCMGIGAIAGILSFSLLPELFPKLQGQSPMPFRTASSPLSLWSPVAAAPPALEINRLFQVTTVTQPLKLYAQPNDQSINDQSTIDAPNSTDPGKIERTLPAGSILQVLNQRAVASQPRWVRLQVCSIPSGSGLTDRPTESDTAPEASNPAAPGTLTRLAQPGDQGWISVKDLGTSVQPLETATPDQQGNCQS